MQQVIFNNINQLMTITYLKTERTERIMGGLVGMGRVCKWVGGAWGRKREGRPVCKEGRERGSAGWYTLLV